MSGSESNMKSKKTNPLFSIITVVYNDVENIEETMKSVFNQTYRDFEYIIIDGKSDDGTVEKIRKYDKEIAYWVSEKDGGIYDAMNKGIKKSKGELLFFLNSNDYFYNKDVLKNIAKQYLKNNKPDILYGRMFFKYNDPLKKDGVPPQIHPSKRLPNGYTIYHQASFIRKRAFEELGLYQLKYVIAGDYEFFCRCFVKGLEFFCIDDIVSSFTHGGRGNNLALGYQENTDIAKKHFGYLAFLKTWFNFKVRPNLEKFFKLILLKLGLSNLLKNLINFRNRKIGMS